MSAAQHHPHRPAHVRPGAHPTVGQISAFIQALFPVRTGDVHFAYHSPRIRHGSSKTLTYLNPLHNRAPASRVVLSITPTSGFYTAINNNTSGAETSKDERHAQDSIGRRRGGPPQTPLAFLHRPWALDRRSVPRRATVIANHKGFDEVLTTGNNVALGRRLGVDVDNRAVVIQGYKGDPDRTIALIGLVGGGDGDGAEISRENILQALEKEFGPPEGVFGFGDADTPLPPPTTTATTTKKSKKKKSKGGGEETTAPAATAAAEETVIDTNTAGQEDTPIRVIAIMNAFHEAEVEQVEAIARSLTSSSTPPPPRIFIPDIAAAVREVTETPPEPSQEGVTEEGEGPIPSPPPAPPVIEKSSSSHVLYLTGAVREPGLLAAQKRGMAVVCVGHRVCEEWGIRHIARLLREEWPGLIVDEVLEDESEVPQVVEKEDDSARQRGRPAGSAPEFVVVDDEPRSGT